jgi:hypothetical protein
MTHVAKIDLVARMRHFFGPKVKAVCLYSALVLTDYV